MEPNNIWVPGAQRNAHRRGLATRDSSNLAQYLVGILGISNAAAFRLLEDSDNCVETAVAMHFSRQASGSRAQSSNLNGQHPQTPAQRLRQAITDMGLPSITEDQAQNLMVQSSNEIDAAIELHLLNHSAGAAPAATGHQRHREEVREAITHSHSETQNVMSDSIGRNEQNSVRLGGAAVLAGPPRRRTTRPGPSSASAQHWIDASLEHDDDTNNSSESDSGEGRVDGESALLGEPSSPYWDSRGGRDFDNECKMTVLPRHAQHEQSTMPHISSVLLKAASENRPSVEDVLDPPLPQFRRTRDGKLYAPDPETTIPDLWQAPSTASRFASNSSRDADGVVLGSITLPLHAMNGPAYDQLREKIGPDAMVWDRTSELFYSYVVPLRKSYFGSFEDNQSSDYDGGREHEVNVARPPAVQPDKFPPSQLLDGSVPVMLALGGRRILTLHPRFYSIDHGMSSESEWALPLATLRFPVYSWGAQFLAAVALLDRAGLLNVRMAIRDGERHVVHMQIGLTKKGHDELFYSGEDGNLLRVKEMARMVGGRPPDMSASDIKKIKQCACVWNKYGSMVQILISTLLLHGDGGLRIGPDCDGLLNYCDTAQDERAAAVNATESELRRQFNISNVLQSVSQGESRGKMVDAPKGLRSKPKEYQLSGLQWMLHRERLGDAQDRGHVLLHPAWAQLVLPDGKLIYFHRMQPFALSHIFFTAPHVGTCGGCLADEMGLGKSLETLMLVMKNKPPRGWAVKNIENLSLSQSSSGRGGGDDDDEQPIPIKATLLVMPSTLIPQWELEIATHLAPGALQWGRYKEITSFDASEVKGDRLLVSSRLRQAKLGSQTRSSVVCDTLDGREAYLHELDLVLMSYEHLRDEGVMIFMRQFGFWRVCLDEAQMIANSNSMAAIMASSLWRRHAWVITGTPITARLEEIQGLLTFLAMDPIQEGPFWRELVHWGCQQSTAQGLLALRGLLRGVMLRRTKEQVASELGLPPCAREDLVVTLSPTERAIYERKKREFLHAVNSINSGCGASSSRAAGAAAGRCQTALVALRQSTCHPQVVRSNNSLMGGSERLSMTEIMQRLQNQNFLEWEQALRRTIDAKVVLAVVNADINGDNPCAAAAPLLETIKLNARASLLILDGSLRIRKEPGHSGGVSLEGLENLERRAAQVQDAQDRELEEERAEWDAKFTAVETKYDAAIAEREAKNGGENGDDGKKERKGGSESESGKQKKQKKKRFSRDARELAIKQVGLRPQLRADIAAERKEARGRWRSWKRLELSALELLAHVLSERVPTDGQNRANQRVKIPPTNSYAAADVSLSDVAAVHAASEALKEELGLSPEALGGVGEGCSGTVTVGTAVGVRRSRRQAGIDAESDAEVQLDADALMEIMQNARVVVRNYKELKARRNPIDSASATVANAERLAENAWRRLRFVHSQYQEMLQSRHQQHHQQTHAAEQADHFSCPICLDELADMRTVTKCMHSFCSSCILETINQHAPQPAPCPICRTDLHEADVFEAMGQRELTAQERSNALQQAQGEAVAEYGSKIARMLEEMASIREHDPSAKFVIFSSWGRLLRLVAEALTAQGMECASLHGVAQPKRLENLHRFQHDPGCAALTVIMNHAGGAAGLTLTSANVAFFMEPCINPGLEQQAAARIFRLGQKKPARVIRLLAEDSVDFAVLELQKWKVECGSAGLGNADVADQGTLVSLADRLRSAA